MLAVASKCARARSANRKGVFTCSAPPARAKIKKQVTRRKPEQGKRMNTYQVQSHIAERSDLTSTEKLVGMMYALHFCQQDGKIHLKQETAAKKCGLGIRAVRNAVKVLVEKEIFRRERNRWADALVPCFTVDKYTGQPSENDNEGEQPVSKYAKRQAARDAGPERHVVPGDHGKKSRTETSRTRFDPFNPDVRSSSPGEENYKRPLVQNG